MKTFIILLILLKSSLSFTQNISINEPLRGSIYYFDSNLKINFNVNNINYDTINYQISFLKFWDKPDIYKIIDTTLVVNSTFAVNSSYILKEILPETFFIGSELNDGLFSCEIKVIVNYLKKGETVLSETSSSEIFSVYFKKQNVDYASPDQILVNNAQLSYKSAYKCGENALLKLTKIKISELPLVSDKEYSIKYSNLEQEISKLKEENLKSEYKYYEFKSKANRFKSFEFGPVNASNSMEAKVFYEDVNNLDALQFLQNTNLNLNFDGNASLFSEIISTYWGGFRLSFGNLVSNSITTIDTTQTDSISRQDDAIQRLIGGGGNVTLGAIYPVFIIKSRPKNVEESPFFKIRGLSFVKLGYDVPTIGTASSDANNFSYQFGLNLDGSIGDSKLSLILNARYSFVAGTQGFRDYLRIGNNQYGPEISMIKFDVGINVLNKFKIGANFYVPAGSDFVKYNFKTTGFFSIIP